MICIPLKSGNRCFGCLEIGNKSRSALYTEKDYYLAEIVSKDIAAGLAFQSLANSFNSFASQDDIFRENIADVSHENLLNPLLKSILVILVEIFKCEK